MVKPTAEHNNSSGMDGLDRLDTEPKLKHDLELGECVELPLSAIMVNYGGFTFLAPLPVYQCDRCYAVLPHKFNIEDKTLRITICQRHKEAKVG